MACRLRTGVDGVPFIQLGDHVMRLDKEELSGEYKERARRELRETEAVISDALSKLREYLQTETDLFVAADDDSFLIKFLRPFRFDADQAFKVMRRFYNFKVKHPEYGKNITPHCIRHVFESEVFVFLPTRTKEGSRIMIANCGTKWDPRKVPLEDMFKAVMVGIEIAMLEPKTQLAGVQVILNMEGLSFSHIYQFSPSVAQLMVDWVQNCAPTRLKGIHVINQPYMFKVLYAVFKPFLGEFLKKRLFFHGAQRQRLIEKIDADALPEYLGGRAQIPDYPVCLFPDLLVHYEKDFITYNTYGYITRKEKSFGD